MQHVNAQRILMNLSLNHLPTLSSARQQVLLRLIHVRERSPDLWADGTHRLGSENVSPQMVFFDSLFTSVSLQLLMLVFFSCTRWQRLITQRADAMKIKPHSVIPLPQTEYVALLSSWFDQSRRCSAFELIINMRCCFCLSVRRETVWRALQQVSPGWVETQTAHPPAAPSPQVTETTQFFFLYINLNILHCPTVWIILL